MATIKATINGWSCYVDDAAPTVPLQTAPQEGGELLAENFARLTTLLVQVADTAARLALPNCGAGTIAEEASGDQYRLRVGLGQATAGNWDWIGTAPITRSGAVTIARPTQLGGRRQYVVEGQAFDGTVTISANNVTLRNCTITGGALAVTGAGCRVEGCAIRTAPSGAAALTATGATNLLIEDLEITDSVDGGITLSNCTGVRVRGVQATNLATSQAGVGNPAVTGGTAALRLDSCQQVLVDSFELVGTAQDGVVLNGSSNVRLVDCHLETIGSLANQTQSFTSEQIAGLRVYHCQRVTATRCTIKESFGYGIRVDEDTPGTNVLLRLRDCTIDTATGDRDDGNNVGDGIYCSRMDALRIEGCEFTNVVRDGIALGNNNTRVYLAGNYCHANGLGGATHGDGMNLAGTQFATLVGNHCHGNHRWGIGPKMVGSSDIPNADITLLGNAATDNGNNGIHLQIDGNVTGTYFHRAAVIGNQANGNGQHGLSYLSQDIVSLGNLSANNVQSPIRVAEAGRRVHCLADVCMAGSKGSGSTDFVTLAADTVATDVSNVVFLACIGLGVDPISEGLAQGDLSSSTNQRRSFLKSFSRRFRLDQNHLEEFSQPQINVPLDGDGYPGSQWVQPTPHVTLRRSSSFAINRPQGGHLRQYTPVRLTGPYTIDDYENGFVYHNLGAGARVDITTSSLNPGRFHAFRNHEATGMRVIVPAGKTLRILDQVCPAGGYFETVQVGAHLAIEVADNNQWIGIPSGTWTPST